VEAVAVQVAVTVAPGQLLDRPSPVGGWRVAAPNEFDATAVEFV
jgi:hypothetical protein